MCVIKEIAEERKRQIELEEHAPGHDDSHTDSELLRAAISYIEQAAYRGWLMSENIVGWDSGPEAYRKDKPKPGWPWNVCDWKPKNPRRDLIRAAALLVAEIERMDRVNAVNRR